MITKIKKEEKIDQLLKEMEQERVSFKVLRMPPVSLLLEKSEPSSKVLRKENFTCAKKRYLRFRKEH